MPLHPDILDTFNRTTATYEGKTRVVYKKGQGPGVLIMHEIPGVTPKVVEFANRVVASGCTVWMPSLFGNDTEDKHPKSIYRELAKACISREFKCLATRQASPITTWLRAMAKDMHAELGGPGVGAIGMCLTGGFALALMVDDVVVAPVLSQPSMPFPFGAKRKAALGVSDDDLVTIQKRARAGCSVLGLRFTEDENVPAERFATLRRELGDGFIAVEIDSSPSNPHGIPSNAHSVVTEHLVDEVGHPTHDALVQVLDFFKKRLHLGNEMQTPMN